MTRVIFAAVLLAIAACAPDSPPPLANVVAPSPGRAVPPTSPPPRDYVGRWMGVEGMFLDVASSNPPGRYRLTMQYDLDHRGRFDATRDGDTLVFERDGARRTLRPTDGKATGLKYLAGKRDCLTVAPGEGYCRD